MSFICKFINTYLWKSNVSQLLNLFKFIKRWNIHTRVLQWNDDTLKRKSIYRVYTQPHIEQFHNHLPTLSATVWVRYVRPLWSGAVKTQRDVHYRDSRHVPSGRSSSRWVRETGEKIAKERVGVGRLTLKKRMVPNAGRWRRQTDSMNQWHRCIHKESGRPWGCEWTSIRLRWLP